MHEGRVNDTRQVDVQQKNPQNQSILSQKGGGLIVPKLWKFTTNMILQFIQHVNITLHTYVAR